MPLFCKLTNHPNRRQGNCYLHDINFQGYQYPNQTHTTIDTHQYPIIIPPQLPPPKDYIEVHNNRNFLPSFRNRMTVTPNDHVKKYCILHQGIGPYTNVITHLVECISPSIGATNPTPELEHVYAVKCKLIAYLDPKKVGATHTNNHH